MGWVAKEMVSNCPTKDGQIDRQTGGQTDEFETEHTPLNFIKKNSQNFL